MLPASAGACGRGGDERAAPGGARFRGRSWVWARWATGGHGVQTRGWCLCGCARRDSATLPWAAAVHGAPYRIRPGRKRRAHPKVRPSRSRGPSMREWTARTRRPPPRGGCRSVPRSMSAGPARRRGSQPPGPIARTSSSGLAPGAAPWRRGSRSSAGDGRRAGRPRRHRRAGARLGGPCSAPCSALRSAPVGSSVGGARLPVGGARLLARARGGPRRRRRRGRLGDRDRRVVLIFDLRIAVPAGGRRGVGRGRGQVGRAGGTSRSRSD